MMYTIKRRWDLAGDGCGFMVYLVYRSGVFRSAHMSEDAARAWIASQP